MTAAGAVVWLALLWYAAPLLSLTRESLTERLRQAIVLAVGCGFALGFTHLLSGLASWVFVVVLALLRFVRFRALPLASSAPPASNFGYAAVLGATAFVAWPSLVRPITDGDSLIYHLPNAASWARAHSVFVTDTHYWWYPGASELCAAVLLCIGGLPLVPLAGVGVWALLGFTLVDWGRERGLPDACAAALALLFVTSYFVIVQGADLQNDVWLTAFVVAALYREFRSQRPARGTLAVLALVKPSGWPYALALAVGARAATRHVPWLALAAFGLWVVRDAVLAAHQPLLPGPALSGGPSAGTSIASHGIAGFRLLFASALRDGVSTLALLAAAIACALSFARTRLALAAIFCLAAFVFTPFGFDGNGAAQLAGGFSLRYGMPALAVGTLFLGERLGKSAPFVQYAAAFVSCVLIAANATKFVRLYWNDGSTHGLLAAAATTFALALLVRARPIFKLAPVVAVGGLAAALLYASRIEGSRPPIGYYSDILGESGLAQSLPAFLISRSLPIVVTAGFPLGMLDVLRASARGIDGTYAGNLCAQARGAGATLVLHKPGIADARTLATAERCGAALWSNGVDEAVSP